MPPLDVPGIGCGIFGIPGIGVGTGIFGIDFISGVGMVGIAGMVGVGIIGILVEGVPTGGIAGLGSPTAMDGGDATVPGWIAIGLATALGAVAVTVPVADDVVWASAKPANDVAVNKAASAVVWRELRFMKTPDKGWVFFEV